MFPVEYIATTACDGHCASTITDGYGDRHGNPCAVRYGHPDSYRNGDPDGNPDGYADHNQDANPGSDGDGDADGARANRYRHGFSDASGYSGAGGTGSSAHLDPCGRARRQRLRNAAYSHPDPRAAPPTSGRHCQHHSTG
jgi:hypothetical protein